MTCKPHTNKLLEGKEGIDVDAIRDMCDQSLAHTSCERLRLQIVKFLVHEKKVDVNMLNEDGWTLLRIFEVGGWFGNCGAALDKRDTCEY